MTDEEWSQIELEVIEAATPKGLTDDQRYKLQIQTQIYMCHWCRLSVELVRVALANRAVENGWKGIK